MCIRLVVCCCISVGYVHLVSVGVIGVGVLCFGVVVLFVYLCVVGCCCVLLGWLCVFHV